MLNLERSLSDLKGRAKDLESEAAELRRENGWLKEIVMLQGNHALASRRRQDRGATKGPSCSDDADGEDTDKRKKMGIEGYRC
jgi:hypothetical protein